MKKLISFALISVLTLSLAACSSGSPSSGGGASTSTSTTTSDDDFKPIKIKFANQNNPDHPYAMGALKFKEEVEKNSDGKITVEIYDSGTLGNERELIEQVTLGAIDMILSSSAPFANSTKEFMVFDLPFIFRDREHAFSVLDGEIGSSLLSKLEDQNMVGLGYWDNGIRHVSNSKRVVNTPEDLKGLKIRLMENEIHMGTFEALGALATPMAWTEVFTALQQGTIDGLENSPTVYVTSALYEVQKYLSLTGHFYSPAIVAINKNVWNSLPEKYQQVIADAEKVARDYERQVHTDLDNANLAVLEEKGMTITEVDKTPFIEAVQPLYDKYSSQVGEELLDSIVNFGK